MNPQKVSLNKLAKRWNPYRETVWVKIKKPITREEVTAVLAEGNIKPKRVRKYLIWDISTCREHLVRIAWLVRHWKDKYPLEIDVGCQGSSGFVVCDGNHRLAAAMYLRKRWVWANMSGDCEWIKEYLWKGSSKCKSTS